MLKKYWLRDCLLALRTGAKINIQHVSSEVSVQIIRLMKKMGAKVYAEVTPQHFSLTEEAVLRKGTLAKVNPPLRTEKDRYALIQGLREGVLDVIATDHAPHSPEEKKQGTETGTKRHDRIGNCFGPWNYKSGKKRSFDLITAS